MTTNAAHAHNPASANVWDYNEAIAKLHETAQAMRKATTTRNELKEGAEALSAYVVRTAFCATVNKANDRIVEKFKGTEDWDTIKGQWSTGFNLAKWLIDGNNLPSAGKGKVPYFTIAGKPVKLVNFATHGENIMFPHDKDTSIITISKRWREVRKERDTSAKAAANANAERLEAYLNSEEGKAKYDGEDVNSLPLLLASDPMEYGRILQRGAELCDDKRRSEAKAKALGEQADMVNAVVTLIPNLPDNLLDMLLSAATARKNAAKKAA